MGFDGNVKFDQLSPIEETINIKIPDSNLFSDVTLVIFQRDPNFQIITQYFLMINSGISVSSISKVRKYQSAEYVYYNLFIGDTQFLLAINEQSQQVFNLLENFQGASSNQVNYVDLGSSVSPTNVKNRLSQ